MTRSKEIYHGSSLAASLHGARQVVRTDDHGVAELAPHVLLSEISLHKKKHSNSNNYNRVARVALRVLFCYHLI